MQSMRAGLTRGDEHGQELVFAHRGQEVVVGLLEFIQLALVLAAGGDLRLVREGRCDAIAERQVERGDNVAHLVLKGVVHLSDEHDEVTELRHILQVREEQRHEQIEIGQQECTETLDHAVKEEYHLLEYLGVGGQLFVGLDHHLSRALPQCRDWRLDLL
jgi:hypothetical protein